MLEIRPIQSKDEQKQLCDICKVDFDADALCYAAYAETGFTGLVQFGIRGRCGYIFSIANRTGIEDADSLFVAGRSALNFIDLCGITDSFCIADADERLIRRIGFKKTDDGMWYIDTKGFFTSETNGACESSK